MATVTVLTATQINLGKVERRLARAGYTTSAVGGRIRVSRYGWRDTVMITAASLFDLPDDAIESAKQLLGLPPRNGITCSFDGLAGQSDAWATAVGIARAVAGEVPLAVLDDHMGSTYLVHPGRGLIDLEEYEKARQDTRTTDPVRRMFGGWIR